MVDMRGHSRKVHRSLLQRDLMVGVPTTGLVLLVIMFMMFVYFLKVVFMIAPVVVLYVVMRHLTSKDPWMIDMVLDNIQQKDVFIP
jgi:type IV secretory pathway VirB3-like protein